MRNSDPLTNRRRTWLTVLVLVAFCAAVAGAAFLILESGDERLPVDDAQATVAVLASESLERAGSDLRVSGVECIRADDREFECVVSWSDGSTPTAGHLRCDERDQCLWRPGA